MNTLTITVFACLAVLASAKPSGLWAGGLQGPATIVGASGVVGPGGAAGPTGAVNGNGAVGPLGIPNALHGTIGIGAGIGALGIAGIRGWDDGQWRGEGLLESQDWASGRGAAIIAPGIAGIGLRGHGW